MARTLRSEASAIILDIVVSVSTVKRAGYVVSTTRSPYFLFMFSAALSSSSFCTAVPVIMPTLKVPGGTGLRTTTVWWRSTQLTVEPRVSETKRSGTRVRPFITTGATSRVCGRPLIIALRLPITMETVVAPRVPVTVLVASCQPTLAPSPSNRARNGTSRRPPCMTGGTARVRNLPSNMTRMPEASVTCMRGTINPAANKAMTAMTIAIFFNTFPPPINILTYNAKPFPRAPRRCHPPRNFPDA